MKAKIISIKFIRIGQNTTCTITFNDPYCNNVKRIVKGVAKCNPDDKFDITLGRRIAEGRAKRAMFYILYKSSTTLKNKIDDERYVQILRFKRETTHIQELLNKHYNEQQK